MADPQKPPYMDKDLYGQSGIPQPQDISQNKLGDCYFISPLGSIAHQQPERIQNAIQYNADKGSFTVTLYESHGLLIHTAKPVQVEVTQADIRKDVELGGDSHLGSAPGRQPAWPAVMEAAYAKMAERKNENLDQGFAHIDSGGQARDALYTLTGEKSQTITASSFKHMVLDEAYNKLDGALKEGRPLLLATNPMKDIPTDGLVKGDAHINAGHEYMLEDISKSADGNVQLTLRNPWGHNYDPAQGVTSKDATVNVDLKTIINNGHLESIDIGPKAIEKKQERDQNKNQDQQQTHQAKTGDPAFDKLLNGLGNHDATTKALQELAQSPSGQAFHAEGRAQYAEVQNQQLQAQIAQQQVQMQSQAPAQAQAGPVMTR